MFVVRKDKDGFYSLPAGELSAGYAKCVGSKLAQKILKLLVEKPMYPKEIAVALGVNEQKIYYHIRNLEKAGIIKVHGEEARQGAMAKYYRLEHPALVIRLKELEESQKVSEAKSESPFLEPFIKDGQLDALVVVGSPDPHGPEKARSRDGYYGIDLGIFLGTFLNYVPRTTVVLDTELKESDLKKNLILIGGPVVNKVAEKVNSSLPIRFSRSDHRTIESTITKKTYDNDEIGIIVLAKNPFAKDRHVLLVAGKRFIGTKAAILAFLKHFKELEKGNSMNPRISARVVEGIDKDSDGIIDDIEFLE